MAEGFALGVDLGTSNTVAVLRWPDGRTRPLLFDGVPLLPSAVYLNSQGGLHVGRDALRLAALDPARLEPNPKRRIDEATVLLGSQEVSTVDLLAAVLAAVARAAVEAAGFLPPAVLTYPASWGSARRAVLAGAAGKAGWPPPRLVPEPVAAARYFADVLRRPVPVGAAIAVFDFGAGTLDVAVVRNTGTGFVVLGAGGVEDLGGLDVDAALVEHLGRLLAGTAPATWAALARPNSTALLRDRGRFWDDVRGAKEMLSRTPVAPVPVPGQDQAVHLTREELDRLAAPLMHRAVYETAAVIHRCGLRPDQLAGLFLVGGSSRLPIVARQLHAQLGVAPTVLEQPELPVAEGALAELVPAVVSPAGAPVAVSAPPTSPAAPLPGGVPGPPPGLAPRPGRPWYRRPLPWVAAAAAVVLLAAAGIVALLLRDRSREVSFTPGLPAVAHAPLGHRGALVGRPHLAAPDGQRRPGLPDAGRPRGHRPAAPSRARAGPPHRRSEMGPSRPRGPVRARRRDLPGPGGGRPGGPDHAVRCARRGLRRRTARPAHRRRHGPGGQRAQRQGAQDRRQHRRLPVGRAGLRGAALRGDRRDRVQPGVVRSGPARRLPHRLPAGGHPALAQAAGPVRLPAVPARRHQLRRPER